MPVLATPRLVLRELHAGDAPFIIRLVNDPAWLRFIGDRGIRTPDDARAYIVNGPVTMYARCGFGLWLAELKATGAPIGICGLIRRDTLPDVDLGFALLPEFCGQGYAHEAAAASVAYARDTAALARLVAITSPDNLRSQALLKKLGFTYERTLRLTETGPESHLYGLRLKP
ncbi:MAG: GNAT family N-acetyltransferase [Verrucomicrobia bacterium]|nr:GNAT family N-acetyltransferase [Verrucomicrobiota bacterium]